MANTMSAETKTKILSNAYYLCSNVIPFMKAEGIGTFEDGYAMWMAGVMAGKIEVQDKEKFTNGEFLIDLATAYANILYAVENSSIMTDGPSTYEDTLSLMIDNKFADENPSDKDMEEINNILNEDD